jgi:molecular chaperone GrpE
MTEREYMSRKEPIKKSNQTQSEQAMDELKTDLQRVQADFINFRRRIEGERGELMEAAKGNVVEQMLPLFDNLERAIAHIPPELAENAWAEGVAQVGRQVDSALGELGVVVYGQVGDEFDPNLHEAIDHDGAGHHIS